MKNLIETLLQQALEALPEALVPGGARDVGVEVDMELQPVPSDAAATRRPIANA